MNELASVWAIRQRSTGWWLAVAGGRAGRGGSHIEPEAGAQPKLFISKLAAQRALAQWLRGKFVANRGRSPDGPDWVGEYYEEIKVISQPHRRREDMEVVELRLVEPAVSQAALARTAKITALCVQYGKGIEEKTE